VTIRVRLPDRHYLEARFAADETIAALVAFVRECMRDPDATPFSLCMQSPSPLLPSPPSLCVSSMNE
jgi:hypothetical protein